MKPFLAGAAAGYLLHLFVPLRLSAGVTAGGWGRSPSTDRPPGMTGSPGPGPGM